MFKIQALDIGEGRLLNEEDECRARGGHRSEAKTKLFSGGYAWSVHSYRRHQLQVVGVLSARRKVTASTASATFLHHHET